MVILWFTSLLTGALLNLEFTDFDYAEVYFGIGVYGVSFFFFTLFLKNIETNEKWHDLIARLVGGLIVAFIIFFMIAIGSISNMCDWTAGKTLYQSKTSSAKIIERWYGCGATDSTPALRKTFKIVTLTSFLGKASEINITKLESEKWSKVYD